MTEEERLMDNLSGVLSGTPEENLELAKDFKELVMFFSTRIEFFSFLMMYPAFKVDQETGKASIELQEPTEFILENYQFLTMLKNDHAKVIKEDIVKLSTKYLLGMQSELRNYILNLKNENANK